VSTLVSHPHAAAFSVGVAQSLARAGQLSLYATGVAFLGSTWTGRLASRFAANRPTLHNRILEGLGPHQLRTLPVVELGVRAAVEALAHVGAAPIARYDALFAAHDAAVSRLRWPDGTTAIYAYEDGALWTFERAQRQNIDRIWDLPIPHYLAIERLWDEEARRWPGSIDFAPHREPGWKRKRKDAELRLATKVSVASEFTRRSLQDLDVTAPVVVVPYGFPVSDFEARQTPPNGRFTVLAVGTHDLRKGTPYLLEAWRRAAIPDAELHLVGNLRLAKSFLDRYAGLFRHWRHVAKADLGARYAAADVLAFPTLGDGFGLVIQEAMCCGTPVITTPCGGGPECIEDGVDGWIVPPRDIDALVERLRFCAANRDAVFEMGRRARARAERWTWRDAGDALVRALA
jgi:glycosyltransferase involved in cell wall biosynthesis